jgi:hypothetical protein
VKVETFWTLFKESVIIQAILALLFAATVCCMFLQGREVPGELLAFLGTVIGFYFGSKNQQAIMKGQVQAALDRGCSDPRIEGLIDQARDARYDD